MDSDPTPGDPERVRELAEELQTFADDVGEALSRINGMAGDDVLLRWAGRSAEAFRGEFDGVPPNLRKLQTSYDLCAQALNAYWPKLQNAQGMADRALAQARTAQGDLTAAQAALSDAQDWVSRAGDEAERLQDEEDSPEAPSESEVRSAVRDHQAAQQAATSAQSRVDDAQERLDAARELARQARDLREEAAQTCARGIDEASDAGIQNRRWWEDAIDWVRDNWDTIVEICKVIVAVVGIVAMIIGGPLALLVLVAALVVLADTLIRYSQGRASLWDVAFAALDCIPGMRGLTTLGGLARGLRGVASLGLRGMGRGLRGLAGRARTTLTGAARGTYNRMRNLVRSRGTDPVDLATGRMYLPQTDADLPGVLPLTFRRRAESGWRTGRWFGPAWASTLDQRLECDLDGVVAVTEDGMLLAYPHAPAGRPVLPDGGPHWPLTRLADGGGYSLTDPLTGHTRHYAPPDPGGTALLKRITDRNGNHIDFDHDPHGVPLAIRHSGGYHLKITADTGLVTALALVAADGTETVLRRYGYDDTGNLTRVTNATGGTLALTWDHRARLTSWTDSNDRTYRYTYDAHDRCIAEGGDAGHLALTLSYDGTHPDWPGHRVTTLTTADGAATHHIVNDNSDVIAEIDPLGHTLRTTYDLNHHPLSHTDQLGNTTRHTLNELGQPLTVTRPDGSVLTCAYDELFRPTSVTLADGATWRRAYDERGNRVEETDPAGATTRHTYDDRGAVTSVTDATGATTRVRNNAAGLPVEITDPLGHRLTRTLDAFGRPVEITDPLGAITRLTWTADGHLARRTDPDGAEQTWTYDGEGNRLSHTDARGNVTTWEYSHFDLPSARTTPDGARHTFAYDAGLRLTRVTNAQGLAWTYEYDGAGRLVAESDYDGRRVTYERDAAGRLTARTNPLGQAVRFAYDALGRRVLRHSGDSTVRFSHDPVTGLVARAWSADCELTLTRDPVGRVLSETVDGRTLTRSYDPAGRLVERVTPVGEITEYVHDAAGRRTRISAGDRVLTFDRDAAGRDVTRRAGPLTLSQEWDSLGRLIGQTVSGPGGDLRRRAYGYLPDGHLATVDDDEDGITALTVDAAGRVTDVHAGNWTETYAYDAAGNQTHADWPGGALTTGAAGDRTYDGSRLVRAGTVRYEYDAAGRVVLRRRTRLSRKPDVWRYEWDAEDRLTAVTTPDGTRWRYRYDPLGRRIAKQRLAPDGRSVLEETRFTWDSAVLVEETTTSPDLPHPVTLSWWHDDNGLSPVAQTERLTDAVTQEEIDSRFFAIITDLVGTPTELVDEEGATAWRARRTLWGLTEWPVDAPAYTPLRLPGQYYDPESGLHYNLFRYYDPETARYACQDPLGIAPGPNPWAYVSNPYSWIDPFGLSPCPFNVALGIRNRGLREFAERNNFTHYLDSETWENDVWAATRNADVRLHVAIDGFRGGDTPQERFLSAYREGLGDNWYATEREMYHVGEAVRREYRTWDSVTFYENGKPITIEEPTSWPRPGG